MNYSRGNADRWQRQVRQLQTSATLMDHANYLRTQRQLAAESVLRANEHLSNITQAYLVACRRAGVRP
jgi:outer membrane murein-binding lipoprotein Lpp